FMNEYIRTANDQTIVLVMIETISAVRDIDRILAVEGLDGLILGPVDLAASMGLFGDFERSEVQEAIDLVIRKACAARVPFGNGQPNDDPTGWLDRGAQLVGIADDEMFIMRGAWKAMERFREITERKRPDVQS
ncbi:MAG TPA: 4-hydroxy-2-oxo-heptane-1,7-dioate aldolase, partial [Chloroflexi bacterium]|nr:4-hydroxy-2-oxo-heptane-1,7-dioate aldolase [Chloroflexota bacterium]